MSRKFTSLNIDSEILKAIESLGFKELTEIQEKVGPVALAGENILGSSSTGSGKTIAFLMPILERTSWEENNANTLILAPSRELALQIKNEYDTLGRYKKLSCVAVFGRAAVPGADLRHEEQTSGHQRNPGKGAGSYQERNH